jgi:tRNA threonylcarbamoyl adenosine modification protein YeaZ
MIGTFTLVIETSTPRASLATIGPGGHLEQREFTSDRSHNAVLFSPLKELLDARDGVEIGLVLAGSGPGSYSGTRVGIAAAQGVAIACGCPAVAVPSILAVPSAQGGAPCLAIGDARRGSFWTARMENSRLLAEPELTDASGLEAIVSGAIADGLAVFSFEEPGRFPLPPELQAQVRLEFPNAQRLWQAWLATPPETREKWLTESPQPMYLKPPHITPAKPQGSRGLRSASQSRRAD